MERRADGKELHGAVWWRVLSGAELIHFFLHTNRSQHNSPEHLQMWYYAGFKGVVFLSGAVCCYTVPDTQCRLYNFSYTDKSSGIRKKFAYLNPRIALLALVIRSGRWTWGGFYRY